MRIKPRIYVRVKVGHQLKLGVSTRNYILQGPTEDEDEASEFTITELKQQKSEREAELRQKVIEEKLEREQREKEKEEAGVSWGMAEDAEEDEDEADLSENPFAVTNNEELFLDDPKKTLRGFFEREGYDLEYKCDELSPGVFICRLELPMIDDEYGKNIICELQHKGKKKECVVQCALEACRILDRHGVLRQANQESRRTKKVQDDGDDSDDDNFFDRTGDVEKKRLKKLGATPTEALTYEQLMEQENEILDKIQSKEHKLQLMIQLEKRQRVESEEDLDAFMSNLSSMESKVDKFAISSTKMEIQNLKIEHQKIQKLVNIAKPSIVLPPIAAPKSKLPLFGKRNSLRRNFGVKMASEVSAVIDEKNVEAENEQEEEDEEEQPELDEPKLVKPKINKPDVAKAEMVEPETDKPDDAKLEVDKSKVAKAEVVQPPNLQSSNPELSVPQKISSLASASSSVSTVEPTSEPPEKKVKSSEPQAPDKKQRKTRVRIRNRLRENIDMNDDDEFIDESKVSTWVAPPDQSGDGTTHLNDKFGY